MVPVNFLWKAQVITYSLSTFHMSVLNQDNLENEEKNRAANLLKLNEACRASLRQTRDPELREEIIAFRQMFESQMDGLDGVIKVKWCSDFDPVIHTQL